MLTEFRTIRPGVNYVLNKLYSLVIIIIVIVIISLCASMSIRLQFL